MFIKMCKALGFPVRSAKNERLSQKGQPLFYFQKGKGVYAQKGVDKFWMVDKQ